MFVTSFQSIIIFFFLGEGGMVLEDKMKTMDFIERSNAEREREGGREGQREREREGQRERE
jgi:hypothetical protein